MPQDETTPWNAVVPVKRLAVAKSRLSGYGESVRRQLALAFAADVVTATLSCKQVARVLVVTDDPLAAKVLASLGARIASDPPGGGLNAALRHAADVLRADAGAVLTISSDLPAMRTAHLDAVLAAIPLRSRAFVADSQSRGTTLLAASHGLALAPAYGAGSRQRHRDSGAVELTGSPGLRRDVDTPDDLAAAVELGVGRHTSAVLSELACFPRSPARCTMAP